MRRQPWWRPAPGASGWKSAVGMVVGDETQVGEPLLVMSQVNVLVPGCLVLGGGLHCRWRGHVREVLAWGGGVM